jgi:serine/threonine-protein kinase
VDLDSIGTTPLNASVRLTAGPHDLVLRNPSFPQHTTTINIEENNTENYSFSFWSTVGQLKLEISPWAEVFIDDEYKDTIPPQEKPLILAPGAHNLLLRHPSLGEWKTEIEVSAGKSLELQFNLRTLLSK